jgi:ADP-ribose pyrophosphatase
MQAAAPLPELNGAAQTDAHLKETRTGGQTLLSGGFLEVHKDQVRLPDGTAATREYIQHAGAVAIIPLLDDGRVVLVRQYRYPLGKVLLEWPAGKRDAGESTLACARRELQEETGFVAQQWAFAGELHNAAAYSTESIWIWFARGLQAGPARPDAGEFVETVTMSWQDLEALDQRGELPDAKTLIGLHWLRACREGRRPWLWQEAADAQDPTHLVGSNVPEVVAVEATVAAAPDGVTDTAL